MRSGARTKGRGSDAGVENKYLNKTKILHNNKNQITKIKSNNDMRSSYEKFAMILQKMISTFQFVENNIK